ncbi:hypothetical protein [Bradyrhizobium zhanjiangense]|uniref:Uncharacterized protein n=1 Tax=Bradyrhizobium zhanjiangense TaxID=1325107 RepID=A0A4Q0SD42_9BRAD|nr:hypothetical protein [Bradyrhizobium zhanjiangense]RXH37031.1 hypothetical protein XH94_24365 [Bradyrhizobium zhanjiangense]
MPSAFQNRTPNINGNEQLRSRSARLADFAPEITDKPEVGIVLPGGCDCITPFAFRSARTLVVAPNVAIANSCSETLILPETTVSTRLG